MKIWARIAFIWLTTLSAVIPAAGQKVVLSGYVKAASGGEALVGAVVFTEDLSAGVSANQDGFYSLQIDRREQVIKCSCAGYVTAEVKINPKASLKYDFALEEDHVMLEAAGVFSKSKWEQLTLPQLGKETVSGDLIRKLPALMGERGQDSLKIPTQSAPQKPSSPTPHPVAVHRENVYLCNQGKDYTFNAP